ncbi:hypothetical protein [Streptomyces fagopyri]|uniref:hypothetical protein n=1 Tax=Streptomyces fagopyri TaxID=2662397 RepID=UPI003818CC61
MSARPTREECASSATAAFGRVRGPFTATRTRDPSGTATNRGLSAAVCPSVVAGGPGPRDDLPPLRGPDHRLVVRENEPGGTGDPLTRRVAVLDARQRARVCRRTWSTMSRTPSAASPCRRWAADSAGEFDVAYVDGAAEQQDLTERRAAVGGHPMAGVTEVSGRAGATEVSGRAMEGAGTTG